MCRATAGCGLAGGSGGLALKRSPVPGTWWYDQVVQVVPSGAWWCELSQQREDRSFGVLWEETKVR